MGFEVYSVPDLRNSAPPARSIPSSISPVVNLPHIRQPHIRQSVACKTVTYKMVNKTVINKAVGTCETVKATFWPGLQPFFSQTSLNPFDFVVFPVVNLSGRVNDSDRFRANIETFSRIST